MTDLDLLAALDRESSRFLAVLRDADPGGPVPSCPDWDAAELLWHLTGVQWFWATIVEERRQDPTGLEEPTRPEKYDELVAAFEEQSSRLLRVLSDADPDTEVYMWAEDRTVGYIRRRQAHEALIHRLDAELTTGTVTPLDAALASDGVHEALDVMFGGCPSWGSFEPTGARIDVRVTDTGLTVPVVLGRFTGTDPEAGKAYDEEALSVRAADPSAPADALVSGTADALDAWLWHRRDAAGLTVEGDRGVFDRLAGVLAQPID
jgi:uncharacterized protein (TIGR03083 family)